MTTKLTALRVDKITQIMPAVVMLVALAALVGWAWDIETLKSVVPGLHTMKVNTALALLFSSVILLTIPMRSDGLRRLRLVLIGLVALIGLLTCLQYFTGRDFGIDQLLFRVTTGSDMLQVHPGRMSIYSASNLVLLAASLLLLELRRDSVVQICAVIGMLLPLLSLGGYIFGLGGLLILGSSSTLALHTAISFLLLFITILYTTRYQGLLARLGASLQKITLAAAGLAFLLTCVGVLHSVTQKSEATNWVEHTYQVILRLQSVSRQMEVFRGDVRSYLLTGQEGYRRSAIATTGKLIDETRFLRQLTHDNPTQQAFLNRLDPLLAQRLNLADRILEKRYLAGTAVVDWTGYTREADQVAAQVSQLLAEMDASERVLLQQRKRILAEQSLTTAIASALTVLVSVLLLAAAFMALRRELEERKHAEALLADSERFIRSVTEHIPSLVGYWNRELRSEFANGRYLEWFGKTPEQMRGARAVDVMGEALFKANEANIQAALQGQTQYFERMISKPDGTTGIASVHYVPDIHDGEVHGFYVLLNDITNLKDAQSRLEALNSQLGQRTQEAEAANVAKGQFLANMSHEIRTPMNAILGMQQLLQHTELTAKQADYVVKTEAAARTLLALLNDILDFSKIEAGKLVLDPHSFEFDKLMRNIAVILSANLGRKTVELVFDVDTAIPKQLVGDALRLQQILINLASNAIKFTERGTVLLRVKLVQREQKSLRLKFSVRDTGIGITPQQAKRIFSGFRQAEASTTRRYGGTGLGLAISQRLVEAMGGELQLESTPGEGSDFYFTIPFEPVDAGESLPSTDDMRMLHTLVVEDNPTAREVIASLLVSMGWQVDQAASGEDALAQVERAVAAGKGYDVIFIDWVMPGIDGWETSQRIRQLAGSQRMPLIVMVTAHGRETLAKRLKAEPKLLDGFLVKPVTASMLFDVVADARAGKAVEGGPAKRLRVSTNALQGLRLLVVEDNPTNQQIARELLSHEGATVELADDGRNAVDAIRLASPPFDVVLMDIQMPDMDGYQAAREIRHTLGLYKLPIIAMTANIMASDREAALEAGMNDHIGKPFDPAQLVSVILRHTGRPQSAAAPASPVALPPAILSLAKEAGIDIATAVGRLGGDLRLYQRALAGFVEETDVTLRKFRAAARSHNRADLHRTLHTYKSLAATIGAQELARLAATLEEAYAKPEADDVEHEAERLQALKQAAQPCLKHVQHLLQLLQAESATPAPAATVEDLSAPLQALLEALQSSNTRALDIFDELSRSAQVDNFIEWQALADAINRLDFAAAAAYCEQIIKTHSNQL